MPTTNATWLYLIYGLSGPDIHSHNSGHVARPDMRHLFTMPTGDQVILSCVTAVDRIPAKARNVELGSSLYAVTFRQGEREDSLAKRFAEALTACVAVVVDAAHEDPFLAVPLPASVLLAPDLVLRRNLPQDPRYPELPVLGPANSWGFGAATIDYVWKILPAFLADSTHLVQAGSLYRESILHAWVADDDVSVFRTSGPDLPPTSLHTRIRISTAYHSAFKAYEALIGGEPPQKLRKLQRRLQSVGIDPDELVGYPWMEPEVPRDTVANKLLEMQKTRDKASAHGGPAARRTTIGCLELKDKQALIRYLILTVAVRKTTV